MQKNSHERYFEAVQAYISGETAFTAKFLQSGDVSLTEKALIEARLLMKRNDFAAAQSVLDRAHPTSSLLIGERFFLQAALASHRSKWQEAVLFAMHALNEYRACENARGLFLSNYNLSVYYSRLGLDELSFYFLNEAESFAKTPSQKVLVVRARACEFSRQDDFKNAVYQIELAIKRIQDLDSVDAATLRSVAGDIFFRAGDHHKALLNLNELQHCKALPDKARAKFDLTVLSALNAELSVLVPANCPEVIEQNVEYFTKWKVISALQDGQWDRAVAEWNSLVQLMPNRYARDFKTIVATDDKAIFMYAVRRLLNRMNLNGKRNQSSNLKGLQAILFEALTSAKIPLRKEDLIEKVWNCEYSPDLDARFYKLIERLQSSSGLEIEVVRHTYRIK